MKPNAFLACMSERPIGEDTGALDYWADFWSHHIASDPEAISTLLYRLDEEPELPDDLLTLFSAVLAAMRMNRENAEEASDSIFALMESQLADKAAKNQFGDEEKFALCQAFVRAGLEPPDAIRRSFEPQDAQAFSSDQEMPDMASLIDDLIPDDLDGYQAYLVLREGVGALQREVTALFVSQMIAQAMPRLISLGRFFLLDTLEELRTAAAEGFAALSRAGDLDAGALSDLIRMRKWLPDQKARSILDRAIKDALRQEASGGSIPRSWTVHRALSSLPDGAGSQSIMASVSRGSQKVIAVVLLKAGHGIKDAYAIPCSSATEQRRTLAEIEDQVTMYEIKGDYLPLAIAASLADGLAKDYPPAPAFVEISEMLGLADVAPHPNGAKALNELSDPEGLVAEASASKIKDLVRQSATLAGDHDIATSWFITSAALSADIANAKTEAQAIKVAWDHLEKQRNFWSSQFARSASILRSAKNDDWQAFAAIVHDVEAGRPLKKIPIFEFIAASTLDVAEQNGLSLEDFEEDVLFGSDELGDVEVEFSIEPEKRGELKRLLKSTQLSPDLIDGYLTAIIVAPRFVTPTDWLGPLMDGVSFPGEGKVQRVLDILMLRYGVIQDDLYEANIGETFRALPRNRVGDWLTGFAQATEIVNAWPKRSLRKDDRKIVNLIKEGVDDEGVLETLSPLLPTWLDAMAIRAVDS